MLTLDYLQNLPRTNEVVAGIGIGIVARKFRVRIRLVVEQVLLDQNAQTISQVSWGERGVLCKLRNGAAALGQECDQDTL